MAKIINFPLKHGAVHASPLFRIDRREGQESRPNDFSPPSDWEARCDEIGNQGGVLLTPSARECLWRAILFYGVRAARSGAKILTPREQKAKLERVAVAAERLGQLLQDVWFDENPLTTWALISPHWEQTVDCEVWLSDLEGLATACRAADHARFENLASKGGRPTVAGFGEFVRALSVIYHFMGGNPTACFSDGADPGVKGPFVRFCIAAHERAVLPEGAPVPANLGDAVRNELRRGDDFGYDTPLIQSIANDLDHERAG
jgi:hypothetical protein